MDRLERYNIRARTEEAGMAEFHQFHARTLEGADTKMEQFDGNVVLVVNTASECGFTPQYEGLEKLYRKYSAQGLVILGFPCNQFGNQEPGDAAAIRGGCLNRYSVSFPMFEKIEVKGDHAHPLFVWLTKKLPGFWGRKVKWNFTKFLVGRDGTPLRRYGPSTKPEKMEGAIRMALEN
jgi:glutathione peroxidase